MAQLDEIFYVNFTPGHTPLPWSTSSTPLASKRIAIPFMDVGCPSFRETLPKKVDHLTLLWTEKKVVEPLKTFGRLVATLQSVIGEKDREFQSVTVLRQGGETAVVDVEGMMIGFESLLNVRLEVRLIGESEPASPLSFL